MDVLTLAMAKAYTDSQRLAYTEKATAETVILSEMSVNMDNYNYIGASISLPRPLVLGETYIVKYDGVEYECEVKAGEDAYGSVIYYVGFSHKVLAGQGKFYIGIGDEPPFFVGYLDDDGHEYACVAVCNDGKTHTISVYQRTETETIHPIDPKYLPGVCLPVVEIADMNAITEAESAAITAAAENALPFVLKWSMDTDAMAIVFSLGVEEGTYKYYAFAFGSIMIIAKDNESGLWALAI